MFENQQKLRCANTQHQNLEAMLYCLNEQCQDQRVCCFLCSLEGLHCVHTQDTRQIDELDQYVYDQSKYCDLLINKLQGPLNQAQELLSKLKRGIRQKYQFTQYRIYNLNGEQINQVLNQLIKFNEIGESIYQQIYQSIYDILTTLNNCYKDLNINQLTYCSISELDQEQSNQLYNQANKLYDQDKYEDAIKALDQSLDFNPQNIDSLWCKGDCLRMTDKFNEALEWYDKALEIDNNHVDSLFGKGSSLRNLNQLDQALVLLEKALVLDPNHSQSLCEKGTCLRLLKQFQEAILWYDKALEQNPNSQISIDGKCIVYRTQFRNMQKQLRSMIGHINIQNKLISSNINDRSRKLIREFAGILQNINKPLFKKIKDQILLKFLDYVFNKFIFLNKRSNLQYCTLKLRCKNNTCDKEFHKSTNFGFLIKSINNKRRQLQILVRWGCLNDLEWEKMMEQNTVVVQATVYREKQSKGCESRKYLQCSKRILQRLRGKIRRYSFKVYYILLISQNTKKMKEIMKQTLLKLFNTDAAIMKKDEVKFSDIYVSQKLIIIIFFKVQF